MIVRINQASTVVCEVRVMQFYVLQTGGVKAEALDIWHESSWGGHFPVKWHLVEDVPSALLEHILLVNNDRKPVTVSRDMQEVRAGRTSKEAPVAN
jgi:hypothetical protein